MIMKIDTKIDQNSSFLTWTFVELNCWKFDGYSSQSLIECSTLWRIVNPNQQPYYSNNKNEITQFHYFMVYKTLFYQKHKILCRQKVCVIEEKRKKCVICVFQKN